jgi:hypothetical protein
MDEEIQALNQIIAMVDQKATKYQNEVRDMPKARAAAEKKLILDLVDDGLRLANNIQPKPFSVIDDLTRLEKQLTRMP